MSSEGISTDRSSASEEQIAHMVELVLMQRIPPLLVEALMAKIHTLSADEAQMVTNSLTNLARTEENYIQKGKTWIEFWKQLEGRIEARLVRELKIIEDEVVAGLVK